MKAKIISLLLLVLLTLSAVSCAQDVIFYDIAREEKLTESEINGNITSIIPLQGKLYVQNGNIFSKDDPQKAHGWKKLAKPDGSGNIICLASDDTCLYAMDNKYSVWAVQANTSTWTKVAENVKALFDNQVMDAACGTTGRTAYITVSDNSVKQLAGSGTPSAVTAPDIISGAGTDAYIRAAVSDGTATVFSSNDIICASGSALYTINKDAKVIRFSTDSGATWTDAGSIDDIALCICPYGTDKLLVGTKSGYQISTIDSTTKAASKGDNDKSTNAESLIGKNRQIISIKAFGSTVYAGVISASSSQYSKLWSLFGTSWNYE